MSNEATIEANKAIVTRFIDEVCNAGRTERIAELFTADVRVHHERNVDHDRYGLSGVRAWVEDARRAFPDQHTRVALMFGENDRVMLHARTTATHDGDLWGVPASGTAVEFTATAIVRLRDGRIAEMWAISDTLGILQQVGAVAPLG